MIDDFVNNLLHKLKPYLNHHQRVLEIGVASGFSMRAIVELVGSYTAIDISSVCINLLKNDESLRKYELDLRTMHANEIDSMNKRFDIIIMNSVIQNFTSIEYLEEVLEKCKKLLSEDGVIFIGDVVDSKIKKYIESL